MPDSRSNIEEATARQDPGALGIGARLATIRMRQAVKVSALAREIGVSPSLISQIERGQSRPSVSTLFALAEALNVSVDAFFRDTAEPVPAPQRIDVVDPGTGDPSSADPAAGDPATVDLGADVERRYMVHRDERAVIDIDGGVRWERLTPMTMGAVDFLELVYAPHAESNAALYRHPGTEMVLVLSGQLHIFVGFERYELGPGDSMCFPSTLPHRYHNPIAEETRAVTVIMRDATAPVTAGAGAGAVPPAPPLPGGGRRV
ncbi:MAG TPA: cupin domain-containing protein [Actinoallomurus sp.]|nr:cupin domain-containing protein [Actinoallomurus sp.]